MMGRWLFLIIGIFVFSTAAMCGEPEADWKTLHETADSRTLSDGYSLAGDPSSTVADLYLAALIFLNFHKDTDALEIAQRIRLLRPDWVAGLWLRAEVLRRRHAVKESVADLDGILARAPRFCPAYITRAYIKYNELDFQGCAQLASTVMKELRADVDKGNYVRALLLYAAAKGMIAHYGGPFSKLFNGTMVLPTLKKAYAVAPDNAAVCLGLGSFYFLAPALAGGDMKEAERFLRRAIELDPFLVEAYVRLAQLLQLKGDAAGAGDALQKAGAIDSQNELLRDITGGTCHFICVPGAHSSP